MFHSHSESSTIQTLPAFQSVSYTVEMSARKIHQGEKPFHRDELIISSSN